MDNTLYHETTQFSAAVLIQFRHIIFLGTDPDFSDDGNELYRFKYALESIADQYGCNVHLMIVSAGITKAGEGYTGIEGVIIYHEGSLTPFPEEYAGDIRKRVNMLLNEREWGVK